MVEDSLSNDESSCERSFLLAALFLGALEHLFEALHIIMIVPTDGAPRDLKTLLDSEVHTAVGDNDVATLAEGTDDR